MPLTDDDGELFSFVLTDFSNEIGTIGNDNQNPPPKASAGLECLHCTGQRISNCEFLSRQNVAFPVTTFVWDGISVRTLKIQNLAFRTLLRNFFWKNIGKSCSEGAPAVTRLFPFLSECHECKFQCSLNSSQILI